MINFSVTRIWKKQLVHFQIYKENTISSKPGTEYECMCVRQDPYKKLNAW